MKTTIFCFSATGNSLAISRKIAEGLGDTEIVSIPRVLKETHLSTGPAETVGFVFPVYAYGVPRIVREFIDKLRFEGSPYIFAVATCGGNPGATLLELGKIFKRKNAGLQSGFAVRETGGQLGVSNPIVTFIRRINGNPPLSIGEKLPQILIAIKNRAENKFETSSLPANALGTMVHSMADPIFKKSDSSFLADRNCNRCGVCLRVCPRENIRIAGGKLEWNHDCEQCFACVHWCPRQALQIGASTQGKARYHHPEVSIEDILLR
jgi:ferredoxin